MFKVIKTSDKKVKCLQFIDNRKVWYKNSLIHNDHGPAVEMDYKKEWWNKGYKHRIGAPAVIHISGEVEWWIYGLKYGKDEYDDLVSTGNYKLIKLT
jgi:hypothetical protein